MLKVIINLFIIAWLDNGEIDEQTGFGPVTWGSWQTTLDWNNN